MPFEKGKPKTGGIRKGQKHVKTQLRASVLEALFDEVPTRLTESLEDIRQLRLNTLDEGNRIKCHQLETKVYCELLPYFTPKMQAIEVKAEVKNETHDQQVAELVTWLKELKELG
jgi:hypothetical protein